MTLAAINGIIKAAHSQYSGEIKNMTTATSEHYTSEQIQILPGLEAVRTRPGMYIGTTNIDGLHHLIKEIVDNSVDEALAGHCNKIVVQLNNQEQVTIIDNGRGIPIDIHEETGLTGLETILTTLHAGGKFDGSAYKVSGGLHGVGSSVVNALSSKLRAIVFKNGQEYYQDYAKGLPQTELIHRGKSKIKNGTAISFTADPSIFATTQFDPERIKAMLKQTAYLNRGLELSLIVDKKDKTVYKFDDGISAMVRDIAKPYNILLPKPFYLEKEHEDVQIEVAFQYHATPNVDSNSIEKCYANCIINNEGGQHLTGFRAALTRLFNNFGTAHNLLKANESFTGEDVRGGLISVISVKLTDPQFEGQTKNKLTNTEVRGKVETVVSDLVTKYMEQNPRELETILKKLVVNKKAREAARQAKNSVFRKDLLDRSNLPGKLADCSSKDPKQSELFIVEGESAGGSSKMARDRNFQAILPLRGKIINSEKFKDRPDRILSSEEIKNLIATIGCGELGDFDLKKLRYNTIIISVDPDQDGAHIFTLLATYFANRMPELIENGHIFLAQTPLYKIQRGKNIAYARTEEEHDILVRKMSTKNGSPRVQRFKGLGEMNANELWTTTMDPDTRVLKQLLIEDMDDTMDTIKLLMGSEVAPRKEWIMSNARFVSRLDV